MENEIIPELQVQQELLKEDLERVIDYYSNKLSPQQIDCLIYLWYGWEVPEISKQLGIGENIIDEWMNSRYFLEAVRAGYGKKREIINYGLEKNLLRAVMVVQELLNEDIPFESRAFSEKIRTARWLVEKLGFDTLLKTPEQQETQHTRIDAQTARIIAEELRNSSLGSNENVEVAALFREDDIIEGTIVNPVIYYNFVEKKEVFTEPGHVNIYLDDEDYKFQCHLCGSWVGSISAHLARVPRHENVSTSMYRKHFGIPDYVPLSASDRFLEIIRGSNEQQSDN